MAQIDLTINDPAVAGAEPTVQTGVTAAAADQYLYLNNNRIMVRVSGGAAAATMTVKTGGTVDGLAIADREVAIPAGEARWCGPYNGGIYNNAAGKVELTFAAADATLAIECVQYPA